MKPCIIIYNKSNRRYEAYSESGRLICHCEGKPQHVWLPIEAFVEAKGFDTVPLNSRCGKTILDKIPQTTI